MTVFYACGHAGLYDERRGLGCAVCGESRVTDVKTTAPRFTGTVTGPHATTQPLGPVAVNLAPGGALTLKEPSHG